MFHDFLNGSTESHQQQQHQSQTRTESTRPPAEDAPTTTQSKVEGPPPPPPVSVSQYERAQHAASLPILAPPPRTNSLPTDKKPRLQLQIPSEQSDASSATASGSSPKDSGNTGATPSRPSNPSSIQLPPPSPSANSIVSAGATGPPNPFARPFPPQNSFAGSQQDGINTPASALPSKYLDSHLLNSPSFSNFDGLWPSTSMLPSPLPYGNTPVTQNGVGFGDNADRKRKANGEEYGDGQGDKKPRI